MSLPAVSLRAEQLRVAEDDVREVGAAAGGVVRVGDVDPEAQPVFAADGDLDLRRLAADDVAGGELLAVASEHHVGRRRAARGRIVEPDGGAELLVLALQDVVDPRVAAPLVVATRVEAD